MCVCKFWISTFIVLGFSLKLSQTAWLRCYRGSMDNYIIASLKNPTPLLEDPCINKNLRTMIYTFGYRGKINGPATTAVLKTYMSIKKKNVILLDWEEEAKSGALGIPLGYALFAVPSAKTVGQELGKALLMLSQAGLNMSEIHLTGHSLGAHVMAYAGRWARERGQVVSRITGLDPARALFEGTLGIKSGLDRTCAKFVDIIHTNPGNYGTSKSSGTVDLWPNYSPDDGLQPGCPEGSFNTFSPEDLCSHDRAWRYLVESIQNGTSFMAAPADNYNTWLDMDVRPNFTIYMGDLANTRARGNFFFTTNKQSPFSRGMQGVMPERQTRSRRNSATSTLSSMDNYIIASLKNPTPLLEDPCINKNLRTMIYTFGYRGKINGPATTAVLKTYMSIKKKNVILLDWEEEAKSGALGIPLGYALFAVPSAKTVGQELGKALLMLSQAGLNMSEIHLTGHSLGAHVMAYAGRWARERGQVVSRITGLDPARALFEGTLGIKSGLDRTCAKFVDIIHTNPGNYGTSKSSGTVDLWPNYSPDDGLQPGCPEEGFNTFSPEDLCSHDRAWRYLVESIQNGTSFMAAPADNYNTWLDMDVRPNFTIYMGDLANTRARGNFFFTTNKQSPFSRGMQGVMPERQTRSRRNSATSTLSSLFRLLR